MNPQQHLILGVWGRRHKVRADGKYLHCEFCCGLSALSHTRAWSPKATIVSYATLQSANALCNVPSTSRRTAIQSPGSHSLQWEELRSNSFFTAIAKQLPKGNQALQRQDRVFSSVFKPLHPTAFPTYSTSHLKNWGEIQALRYCNMHN